MKWPLPALVVAAALLAPAAPADAALGCRSPVARAVWTQEAQGARIHVFPSRCGRRTAWASTHAVLRAALRAGGRTVARRAVRRSLEGQLRCHAVFAPYKRSWNLETWRPVVSSSAMVAALCNPDGPAATRRAPAAPLQGLFATVLAVALQRG